MANIQIKVKTDVLRGKASEITNLINNISNSYDVLKRTAESSSSYWIGDAATDFRRYVESMDDDMQKVIGALRRHPSNLAEIAGVYEKNESGIVEQAGALPTDVIS